MGYQFIRRQWPKTSRTATKWLMPLELAGIIPMLVIFGLSQPDLYRSALWEIGWENKLNSNPNMVLYAHANYQPVPMVPMVWSQFLTNFNVAISVVSLFFLLAKLIAFIMNMWYPFAAVFVNIGIAAIYCVSVYGQVGPDYADSRYPAPAAWYFRQGCGLAKRYGKYSSCQMAQSSLGLTAYMLVLYLLNLGFAASAMWPHARNDQKEVDEDDHSSTAPANRVAEHQHPYSPNMQMYTTSSRAAEQPYSPGMQMYGMKSPASIGATPFTPKSPFTPRTQAFHTLDQYGQPRQAMRYG